MRFNTNRIPTRWVLSTCLVLALLVVSSQGAAVWVQTCEADIFVAGSAEAYNAIAKVVQCKDGDTVMTEQDCIDAGAGTQPTVEFCAFKDLPVELFQATPSCTDLFTIPDDLNTPPNTERCLLQSGESSVVITNGAATVDSPCASVANKKAFSSCVSVRFPDPEPTCTTLDMTKAECIVTGTGAASPAFADDTPCGDILPTYFDDFVAACSTDGTYAYEYFCEYSGSPFTEGDPWAAQCVYTPSVGEKADASDDFCTSAGVTKTLPETTCTYADIRKTRFQTMVGDGFCQYVVKADDAVEDYTTAYCVVANGANFYRLASDAAGIAECTQQTRTPKDCITVSTTATPSCTEMNMAGAACSVKEGGDALVAADAVCAKAIADERTARANWLNAAQVDLSCAGTPIYVDTPTCVWSTTLNNWSDESGVEHICKLDDTVYDWEFCAADKNNLGTDAPATTDCATGDYADFSDECADVFKKAAADNKVTYKADAFESACVVKGTDNVPHIVADTVCTGAGKTAGAGKTIDACTPGFTAPTNLQNECTVVPDLSTTDAVCKVATYTIVDGEDKNDLTACDADVTTYLNGLKTDCENDGTYKYVATCEFDGNTADFESQTPSVKCVYTKEATTTDVVSSFCVDAGATAAPTECSYDLIPAERFLAKSDDICQYVVSDLTGDADYNTAYCVVSNGKDGDDAAINRLSVTASGNLVACSAAAMSVKECVAVATTVAPTCTQMNMAGAACSTKGANTKVVPTGDALCIKAIADERIARANWQNAAQVALPCEGTPAYVQSTSCVWDTATNDDWTEGSGTGQICQLDTTIYDWEFCAADKNNLGTDAPATVPCVTADYAVFSGECADVFKKAAVSNNNKVPSHAGIFAAACVVTGTDNVPHIVADTVCTGTPPAGKAIADCAPAFVNPTNLQNECTVVPDLSTTNAACTVATYTLVDGNGNNDLTACDAAATAYLNGLKTDCQAAGVYAFEYSCVYDDVVNARDQSYQCYYTTTEPASHTAADATFCSGLDVQTCTYADLPAALFVAKGDAACNILFATGGSDPDAEFCGIYTSETTYVPVASSVANVANCIDNAKKLSACTTTTVVPNEENKCTAAPTASCIVSGTEGDSPVAVTGNACVVAPEHYAYSQTEFAGCEAGELAWNGAACDGQYDGDAQNFGDAKKTCMYGGATAAVQFCEQNMENTNAACTFADLTAEGARQATCAELYPADAALEGKAQTADVGMKCVIATKTGGSFLTTFATEAEAPTACKNLAASTLATCTDLTFATQPTCTSANMNGAKCIVKGTEVEFDDDSPCDDALAAAALERYTPNAACGTYAIKPADGACYFETADEGATYTAKKNAEHVCYLTGANENPSSVAELKFCLEQDEWANYPEGMTKDCSNEDAGLTTSACDYTAAVPHATCSVRLQDGTTQAVSEAQCVAFGKAACASVTVTSTGSEVECSTEATPTPVEVTRVATCAIELPSGALVPVPEEDTYGYEAKCAEAIDGKDGQVEITPAKCLPSWSVSCSEGNPVVKCMLDATVLDDAECANIAKIGKEGAALCTNSLNFHEWRADQPASCPCGTIPETTWTCVETSSVRHELSPIDPFAIRFDYTDARLKNAPPMPDESCTQAKPTFNVPCECPASTAVYVSGTGLELTLDGNDNYLKRTPNCGTNDCNIQTVFPSEESQLRSGLLRTVANPLDQTTCTNGYIDGDVHTRKCQPSDTPYWTSAKTLYYGFAPDECSAACQVKSADDKDLAVLNYASVCVQDDHDVIRGAIVKVLPDSACAGVEKPVVACNRHECVASAQWVTGAWQFPASISSVSGFCKTTAGSITFTRTVQCYRGGNVVADAECLADKPDATYQVENADLPTCSGTQPATWITTAWSACDAATGLATRSVYCARQGENSSWFVAADSACPAAQKPSVTPRSCCVNGGTFNAQTQKCTCAPGFNGDYCEIDNAVRVSVPDFQYSEKLFALVAGQFEEYAGVTVDLLAMNNDFVARIKSPSALTPGGVEWTLPAGLTLNARYRVRLFSTANVNAISNDFALVPKLDCENGGTPNYPAGRCTCTGTFGGRLCETDLCDGCDSTCAVTNGVARTCCSTGRRFSMSEGTCVDTCTLQCSNGGFGVSKPDETPACQCACAGGWEGATCATCPLDCSANGKHDATCEACTCNRGYSTRVAALQCQCRSLVVRLAFRRNSALPELALNAMKADIAGLLGINADLVTTRPNNFNSRTGRQNVDIVISSTECASSAPVDPTSKPASWFKPADFADEFASWSTTLQTALAASEPLPSFVGYDATLGAAIEDPACDPTDVSATCMDKAVVGNGGPAVSDDGTDSGSSGSDDDDLKWIVPIAVLIPLAVIITGVILYVKCKPQAKATTYASSRADGNTDVEMTVH